TPYYMSPEQAVSREVLPQSDLYSCGVIMFLLATGSLPFMAPSPIDVATHHVKTPPPRPSAFNPRVDRRLEALILRCRAKDPLQRPASGTELAELLAPIPEPAETCQRRGSPLGRDGARTRGATAARRTSRWTTGWAVAATAGLAALGTAQLMGATRHEAAAS